MDRMSETADPAGKRASRRSRSQKTPIAATIDDIDCLSVTCGDAPVAAAENETFAAPPIRLHFTYLDHFADKGIVACGWLCDPEDRVRQIMVEGGDVDLLRDAALLTGSELYEIFDVAPGARPKLGFVAFIMSDAALWKHGVTLAVRLATGATIKRFAGATGRITEIHRIIDTASVQDILLIAERAIVNWGRYQALRHQLERVFERVHQRIDAPRDARVEILNVIKAGAAGMLLTGRLANSLANPVRKIVLVSLFGRRVTLPASLPRVSWRASSAAAQPKSPASGEDDGFAVFVPIEDFGRDDRQWLVEVHLDSGSIERIPFVCPTAPEPIDGIAAALVQVDPAAPNLAHLLEGAVSPTVDALWAEARRTRPSPTEMTYGSPSGAVQVSIIVPIYRRIDLLHHQIVRFSNDPELRSGGASVELLYILDDPRLTHVFERSCRDLYDIYRLPFRSLTLHRNAGYAGANNTGAAAASGSILLFLNSDVLPKRAGWVGELVRRYRGLEHCGILGCRLLFEDGSIQHAGMSFRRSSALPEAWENDHLWKGLPPAFDPHRAAVRVPAVTGACLMIEQALFHRLGGWSEQYVLGDFEDSDLCLRAHQQGWKVYYTPEVELYHLERQSAAAGEEIWRQNLNFHNMLKHSRNWGAVIPTIVDQIASGG
jgi:GT2 family glycosyltransferase